VANIYTLFLIIFALHPGQGWYCVLSWPLSGLLHSVRWVYVVKSLMSLWSLNQPCISFA